MFLFVILLMLPVGTEAGLRKYYSVTVTGRLTCYGTPIANILVRLMDDDLIFDDTMASGRTDNAGNFKLSGKGRDTFNKKPDIYTRIEYNYLDKMRVVGLGPFYRTRTTNTYGKRDFSGTHHYGTIDIRNDECTAYVLFRAAILDYFVRSKNTKLPYSELRVQTDSILTAGVPWSTTDKVRLTKGHKLILSTAKHELAHTIRQSFDGNNLHFLADIVKYKYAQHHNLNSSTNEGFAFNEGWAEYWEGECDSTSKDSKDMKIEGNVAAALCKLAKCKGDEKMWNILEENKESVHSYSSFKSKLCAKYPGGDCCQPPRYGPWGPYGPPPVNYGAEGRK